MYPAYDKKEEGSYQVFHHPPEQCLHLNYQKRKHPDEKYQGDNRDYRSLQNGHQMNHQTLPKNHQKNDRTGH
ncbi:hypothetical protein DWQ72_04275 [Salmonella enterica]|nr:hypothetical protein [Salmonella enterica]ECE5792337.1 hypothetical protein [Salmonella enterica subsp. diarizonae]EBJ5712374.1 hypothetical protein [Salmonella enterica]ECE6622609.1 hypothetical protein [Salmonella enterica subsp. diarizonae]ECI3668596.1 hypothetical protein [Salmonella enterica subsp. diarizonae]